MGWADQFRDPAGWGARMRCEPVAKEFSAPAGPTVGLQGFDQNQAPKKKRRPLVPVFITKASKKPKAEQVADKHEPQVAARVERALTGLKSKAATIAETGEVTAETFKEQIAQAISPLVAAAREGGDLAAANDNASGGRGSGGKVIRFTFDHENPKTRQAIQTYAFDLIQQISEDTAAAVRRIVDEGQALGRNPIDTARQIRDVIGLTDAQGQAVINYRADLEQGNPRALTRALRDKRFDPTVRSAIEGKKPLAAEQVDAIVERYKARYIAYRATTIARTEAMRAVNTGGRAALQQAIDRGDVDPTWITRKWLTAGDERVRGSHRALNGQTVGWNEPYSLPDGTTIRWPHDDQAPPALSINCRCTEVYQISPPEGA